MNNPTTTAESAKSSRRRPYVDPVTGVLVKVCKDCGASKPVVDFPDHHPPKNGRRYPGPRCEPCHHEHYRKYVGQHYAANPEAKERKVQQTREWLEKNADSDYHHQRYLKHRNRQISYHSEYRKENKETIANQNSKQRARRAGCTVVEDVDREVIIARDERTCYICGKKPSDRDLTLDHLTPLTRSGSHTADNLKVCCRDCNARKGNLTVEEFTERNPHLTLRAA